LRAGRPRSDFGFRFAQLRAGRPRSDFGFRFAQLRAGRPRSDFGFRFAQLRAARPRSDFDNAAVAKLEQLIPQLMSEAEVPGLAIALIRDSKVIWTQNYGFANTETKVPVNNATVFEAASLTKPVFAYAVLKLVDAGKLNLDTPLIKYLPGRYDVGDDARLDQMTARHVLSHTTGFPNWRPRGAKELKIHFTPGDHFSYSGEGFVYLSKVVEHITGESTEAFVKRMVFDPLEMKSSTLVWRNDYESLKAFNHDWAGGVSGRRKPDQANAAASLQTTANDYAKFVIAMLKGNGLKPATARLMLTPQSNVTLNGAFNLDKPDAKRSSDVLWGLGWGLEKTAEGTAFWHWGDNGDTKAFVLAYPQRKTGLVMFANSANGLSLLNELVRGAMGNDHPALAWLSLEQYNSYPRLLLKTIVKSDAETALADYRQRRDGKAVVALTENQVNTLGYQLLRLKRVKDAIAVFKQNTVDFPQASNTWDSLSEAYMTDGDKESAIKYYKKSLELNPENSNAVEKLKELESSPKSN
jgi:CubicO group peptidase (beta-lactamase class C family)